MLSFLSKHSTRDPGVCLDEIAIAIGTKGGNIQTVLVESETEVQPPSSISHIQWLDMHQWQDEQQRGESHWHQWYATKLREVIAVVESDASRKFAGEIDTLEGRLQPNASDFSADTRVRELLRTELVGRRWIFEALEAWRVSTPRRERMFWLLGGPGMGKSAFVAHLAHYYGRGTVLATQFCRWQDAQQRDPHAIVRTLAFQLATRLPDYRKLLLRRVASAESPKRTRNPSSIIYSPNRCNCVLVVIGSDT